MGGNQQQQTMERGEALNIASTDEIKEQMALVPVAQPETVDAIDPEIAQQADDFVKQLLDPNILVDDKRNAIDSMGLKTQENAAHRSGMLREPIRELIKTGDDGGPVAQSLLTLNEQVTALDPVSLDTAGAKKLLGFIPIIGKPLKRYFARYQSAQAIIDEVIKSLEKGRDQLKRDNQTLAFDQQKMRESTDSVKRAISLGQALDMKLEYALEREINPEDTEQINFVQEDLIFPLRQRIIDLQQTLAVNQQGIMTTEIIIRNNRELVRGVSRALNVTIVALQTAVACALALAHQKIVLDKIEALNKTTSDLIAHTAERLKTQGVEIHKQAASSMLSMESLEQAFADIKQAMDDISRFRREALPQMAQNIQRLDTLTDEASQVIEKMDRGAAAQSQITIDVDIDTGAGS